MKLLRNNISQAHCELNFMADLEALLEFAGKLFQVVQSWRTSAAEQREAARSGRLLGVVARLVMCALFCSSYSSSSSTSAWRVRREAKALLMRRLYLSDGELVADLLPALLEQWRVSVADGLKACLYSSYVLALKTVLVVERVFSTQSTE